MGGRGIKPLLSFWEEAMSHELIQLGVVLFMFIVILLGAIMVE
jgi:hypothetical protein